MHSVRHFLFATPATFADNTDCSLLFYCLLVTMVDLSDPKGPVKEGIDNTIFIVPGVIMAILMCK